MIASRFLWNIIMLSVHRVVGVFLWVGCLFKGFILGFFCLDKLVGNFLLKGDLFYRVIFGIPSYL